MHHPYVGGDFMQGRDLSRPLIYHVPKRAIRELPLRVKIITI